MISLLDANLLIALFDEAHIHHQQAHNWFADHRHRGWATCPLTENACIRILSHSSYPGKLSVFEISRRLKTATESADHHFWPDSISLLNREIFQHRLISSPRQLTDLYLLGLAVVNQGRLATFDKGILLSPIPAATGANLVIL